MRHLLVVLAVFGCGGKKDDKPAPEPKVVSGSGSAATPATPDPACVDATTKLGTWLGDLTAEGASPVTADGATLAKLDGESAKPLAEAPVVFINAKEVSFQGHLLSTVPIKDHGKGLKDALAAAKATDTLFVVDGAVPWSDVTTAVTAVAASGHAHITFVFAAGVPGKTSPPPPSAVDKELDELAKPADPSKKASKLYDPKDPHRPPSVPDKIFKDCTVTDLMTKIGAADTSADKDKLIVEGLPKAIAACGCKVEIASVQRLMWSWYGHDSGQPLVGVGVDIASAKDKGTAVTAKPTAPWSDAGKIVAAAAKAGKPLAFK
jgi:hypothetical protein